MKWLGGFVSASCLVGLAQAGTVREVLDLLAGIQKQNRKEGKEDTKLHAEFTCYCNDNTETSTTAIKDNNRVIAEEGATIDRLLGETGKLSQEVSQLQQDMDRTDVEMATAKKLREDQKSAFDADETDLKAAIGQMTDAINTLTGVGGDMTNEDKLDNQKVDQASGSLRAGAGLGGFMQSRSRVQHLNLSMRQALRAASALVGEKQHKRSLLGLLESEAPVYEAQSGQVTGILKNMLDTFRVNLQSAQDTEASQLVAHADLMGEKQNFWNKCDEQFTKKQGELGANDLSLADSRSTKKDTEDQLADNSAFLQTLTENCAARTKAYELRKQTRAQEDVAIAQAVAVLDSDDAADTFRTSGDQAFVQVRAVSAASPHQQVVHALLSAARKTKSLRLSRFASVASKALRNADKHTSHNAFKGLFLEIEKLIKNIDTEETVDDEKDSWCTGEQADNKESITTKDGEITANNAEITRLAGEIDVNEQTIIDTNGSIEANATSQQEANKERQEALEAFNASMVAHVKAKKLIVKATATLTAFYDAQAQQADYSAEQQKHAQNSSQNTVAKGTKGEAGEYEVGKGNKVITLLETIAGDIQADMDQQQKDETASFNAHATEIMQLKDTEKELRTTLSNTQEELINNKESKNSEEESLAANESAKKNLEDYRDRIEPGCTYIQENLKDRKAARKDEKAALNTVKTKLSDSPSFKNHERAAELEGYGACKLKCEANASVAKCKACMADVTVVAYCTSNPTTPECP